MSWYYMKNLDVNKENGTISAEFASNNVFPKTYFKEEIEGKTFHEKYSCLIYNIISGNFQTFDSSKYYVLCNTWNEPTLTNYILDCDILGYEKAFDKYKNVIEALLEHKQPENIKSEIELHYKIDYGKNKDYENLSQKVRDISNFMQKIRHNNNLSHQDRLLMLKEFEEKVGISFPLVTMRGLENSTKMYLNFNISNDGFTSYKVTVENIETGLSKSYQSEKMNITWFTDFSEKDMACKIQSYEQKFLVYQKCKDFLNKKIYSNSSQNIKLNIDSLNIKDNEIRLFLDILNEDDRSKNYSYDNKTKEIIFNPEIEKEIDDD